MTFILSEVNHDAIFMASDSSETWIDSSGNEKFVEVDKTLYFPEINIGISTWGDAEVLGQGLNDWLKQAVLDFAQHKKSDQVLADFTAFLSERLDKALGLDGTTPNSEYHMGLHIAGYNSSSDQTPPGICHVFIDPNFNKFQPQETLLSLPPHISAYHLRNGMFEEFAIMWPALYGIDTSFRNLIALNYQDIIRIPEDPIALKAEWLGSWVKQMCLVIKMAGLREYIGKKVKVLSFNQQGDVKWFHLPEMEKVKP
jgi:hypothetical protein